MCKTTLTYLRFWLIGFGISLKKVDRIMEILK